MKTDAQKGAVAPLIAVLLFVIVICVALVVDLGHVHNVKIELQRAVDAAALAGVRHLPDEGRVDTVAIAAAAANSANQQSITITSDEVVLGTWDKDNLTASAADRFTATATNPNAVYVRASQDVEHIFFIFVDATTVTADAIALSEPINPIFPLSIISCIPLDAMISNPGSLPGEAVCDIRYYNFAADTDDTAAWTGLTFGGGAPAITQFLDPLIGRELFEKTVFTGLASTPGDGGLENAQPDPNASPDPSYGGNQPVELNIPYGLGKVADERLAPPESFPEPTVPPDMITRDSKGIFQPYNGSTGPFDPMLDYNNSGNGALPRWYNLNNDDVLKTDDHFVRIWSLDGHLIKGPIPGSAKAIALGVTGESFVEYQDRLQGYFEGTLSPPDPYNDGRLKDEALGGSSLISDSVGNAEATAIAAYYTGMGESVDKADVEYWPDFLKIMEHAGYPKVSVTNGVVTTVLDAFFSNPEVADEDAETLKCSDNAPLNGETLRLQIPVIFAGFCESWKALSNASTQHTLVYVGLGDFLITRGWKNPAEYDCPSPVTLSANGVMTSCPDHDFDPALVGGDAFSDIGRHDKAVEGLFKVPQVDTSAAASIMKVYLVE
jgi:Flp pilus assembly protein TadG